MAAVVECRDDTRQGLASERNGWFLLHEYMLSVWKVVCAALDGLAALLRMPVTEAGIGTTVSMHNWISNALHCAENGGERGAAALWNVDEVDVGPRDVPY